MNRARGCFYSQLPCLPSVRSLSISSKLASGHNRWSKIRHDKAKVDASVNKLRSALAYEICLASKESGPDPRFNPGLAAIIAMAKKQGFPKASIEAAIARGQGVSPSGAPLTSLTLEAMVPPSIGVIIECQTDSRLRILAELKHIIKEFGGSVSPTSHLFERTGRIILNNSKELSENDIFDMAIDAGATNMEMGEDGTIIVYTEPKQTAAASKGLSKALDLEILSSELAWVAKKDTTVDLADKTETLRMFLDRLHDNSSVQEVYVNAT